MTLPPVSPRPSTAAATAAPAHECADSAERASLLRAQKIAQAVSDQAGSGKLGPAELQASAARAAASLLL